LIGPDANGDGDQGCCEIDSARHGSLQAVPAIASTAGLKGSGAKHFLGVILECGALSAAFVFHRVRRNKSAIESSDSEIGPKKSRVARGFQRKKTKAPE
jgi:hypothetical protein